MAAASEARFGAELGRPESSAVKGVDAGGVMDHHVAAKLVGTWRLHRCLGHLAGAGRVEVGSTARCLDAVPVAAAPKSKRKNPRKRRQKEAAASSTKSKGDSKSASKSGVKSSKSQAKAKGTGKSKSRRKGKGKRKRSKKKIQQTGSEDEAARVGEVVGTIPPSAPRAGSPARPWDSGDQAQKVAETSEWLQQQRQKLGLDGNGFDVETLKKKKAERLKKGNARKPAAEDPLIAKLKAMGETRLPNNDGEAKKGKL